jgi:hypothetical protein
MRPIAASVGVVLAAAVTACSAPAGGELYPPGDTAPGSSPAGQAVAGDAAPPSTLPPVIAIERPADAATVQLCIDTTEDDIANPVGAQVLSALAGHLDALGPVTTGRRGIFVDAFMASSAPGADPVALIESSIADVQRVEIQAGLSSAETNALLLDEAKQRKRIAPAEAQRLNTIDALRTVEVPLTTESDVMRCVSRANNKMAGRAAERRVLVIVSALPVAPLTTSVRGTLAGTHSILVLAWGPDLAQREVAWRQTWESIGGTPQNVFFYEVADGQGQVLADALKAVLL